ncbi:MAG: helix-turn-helix domain-containing protein [Myxococcota bacterium]|nr:helix-turn-helix domain-containing protein [Myxococcota bacterium]
MNADDLFTAPQVAKICSTDLKTIHNWVNRGEIKSFRTPGRHLRFRRQDILEFLNKFGYPVPDGFSPARQRVVMLDKDEASMKPIKRVLSRDFDVDAYTDQVDALLAIGKDRPHLVLVSAAAGDEDELTHLVARLATKKETCPVAVYTEDSSGRDMAVKAGASDIIPTLDGKEIRKRIFSLLK